MASTLSKIRDAVRNTNATALARMNAARLGDRQTDELIGMVRMALADGILEAFEADFLFRWLHVNEHARTTWPGRAIYARLLNALADDVLSPDEEGELLELLAQAVGDPAPEASAPTSLPLNDPPPPIRFTGRRFCFTGRFYSGTRAWCMQQAIARGGDATDRLTTDVHYLVVGQNGTLDWLHSTHGRKIETALRYNDQGSASIAIVGEQHWAGFL